MCRSSRLAHHNGHQANARKARPRQAIIMPHNVAVGRSKSGNSVSPSRCSPGVIWPLGSPQVQIIGGVYALVRSESMPLAIEPMSCPMRL